MKLWWSNESYEGNSNGTNATINNNHDNEKYKIKWYSKHLLKTAFLSIIPEFAQDICIV